MMTRRELIAAGAGLAALPATAAEIVQPVPVRQQRLKKALVDGMLPGNIPLVDRFKLARDCGFEAVEASPWHGQPLDKIKSEAEAMRKAADAAGIKLHSMIFGGWHAPLSSPDASTIERGLTDVKNNLVACNILGANGLLLVPAVVNAKVRYEEAWKTSQANIKKLVPAAEAAKVSINIEEVWNNFLLSPLEFKTYVDSFHSPMVQAYFDVGNVVRFGWPQDWIRTLGKRIQKVHIKDFKGGPGLGTGGQWVNLWDGSIDWPEVRKAFAEVGYNGYLTCELGGGDAVYLKDVSARVDRIINSV